MRHVSWTFLIGVVVVLFWTPFVTAKISRVGVERKSVAFGFGNCTMDLYPVAWNPYRSKYKQLNENDYPMFYINCDSSNVTKCKEAREDPNSDAKNALSVTWSIKPRGHSSDKDCTFQYGAGDTIFTFRHADEMNFTDYAMPMLNASTTTDGDLLEVVLEAPSSAPGFSRRPRLTFKVRKDAPRNYTIVPETNYTFSTGRFAVSAQTAGGGNADINIPNAGLGSFDSSSQVWTQNFYAHPMDVRPVITATLNKTAHPSNGILYAGDHRNTIKFFIENPSKTDPLPGSVNGKIVLFPYVNSTHGCSGTYEKNGSTYVPLTNSNDWSLSGAYALDRGHINKWDMILTSTDGLNSFLSLTVKSEHSSPDTPLLGPGERIEIHISELQLCPALGQTLFIFEVSGIPRVNAGTQFSDLEATKEELPPPTSTPTSAPGSRPKVNWDTISGNKNNN